MSQNKQRILSNFRLLQRSLNPSNELIDLLAFSDIIGTQMASVEEAGTPAEKSTRLLRLLCSIPDENRDAAVGELCEALKQSGQEHVAKIFGSNTEETPMSEDHYQLLRSKEKELCNFVEPSAGLLVHLRSDGVFTDSDVQRVRLRETRNDMTAEIVDILSRKSDASFDRFVKALNETGQQQATFILTGRGELPMSEAHRQVLHRNRGNLSRCMDPKNGLLTRLVDDAVFNDWEYQNIQKTKTIDEMSLYVVDLLLRKSDFAFSKFVSALRNSGQEHAAYLLTGEGSDPPLASEHVRRLSRLRNELVTNIEPINSDLVDLLATKGVLIDFDKQRLMAETNDGKRNAVLLDLIARKSQNSFVKFVESLHKTNQRHVAVTLQGLVVKGTIKPCFDRDVSPSDSEKLEEQLVDAVNTLKDSEINNKKVLTRDELSVTGSSKGSIDFRCFNSASLTNFHNIISSRQLDKLFSELICPPFSSQGLKSIEVRVSDAEFARCAKLLAEMALMSSEHQQALQAAAETCQEKMAVTDGLLNKLSLCKRRRQAIQSTPNNKKRVQFLMSIVSRQADPEFFRLVSALRETGNSEVAEFLESTAERKSQLSNLENRKAVGRHATVTNADVMVAFERRFTELTQQIQELHRKQLDEMNQRIDQMEGNVVEILQHLRTPTVRFANGRRAVVALAMSGTTLYVLHKGASQVVAYDIDNKQPEPISIDVQSNKRSSQTGSLRSLAMVALQTPQLKDMSYCGTNRCLYVSDVSNCIIHVVNLATEGNAQRRSWSVIVAPCGVSVIPCSCNVLVCFREEQRLTEYTPVADVSNDDSPKWNAVRHISLPADMAPPWRAIAVDEGSFVVCHGGDDRRPLEYGVSRIEVELNTIEAVTLDTATLVFASKKTAFHDGLGPGSDRKLVHHPLCIAVDQIGRIFVANCRKNRIELLKNNLELDRVILSAEQGIDRPEGLWVSPAGQRLFVGMGNGRIIGFTVTVGIAKRAVVPPTGEGNTLLRKFRNNPIAALRTPETDRKPRNDAPSGAEMPEYEEYMSFDTYGTEC